MVVIIGVDLTVALVREDMSYFHHLTSCPIKERREMHLAWPRKGFQHTVVTLMVLTLFLSFLLKNLRPTFCDRVGLFRLWSLQPIVDGSREAFSQHTPCLFQCSTVDSIAGILPYVNVYCDSIFIHYVL